jgi:hypothetical protein
MAVFILKINKQEIKIETIKIVQKWLTIKTKITTGK